jgi:hypothetical protein
MNRKETAWLLHGNLLALPGSIHELSSLVAGWLCFHQHKQEACRSVIPSALGVSFGSL